MKDFKQFSHTVSDTDVQISAVINMGANESKGKFQFQFSAIKIDGKVKFAILTSNGFKFVESNPKNALDLVEALIKFKKFRFNYRYEFEIDQVGGGYLVTAPFEGHSDHDLDAEAIDVLSQIGGIITI